jgi:hypothetical protein
MLQLFYPMPMELLSGFPALLPDAGARRSEYAMLSANCAQ